MSKKYQLFIINKIRKNYKNKFVRDIKIILKKKKKQYGSACYKSF